MHVLKILAGVTLAAAVCFAQEKKVPAPPVLNPEPVCGPPSERITNKLIVLVDASNSMGTTHYSRAVSYAVGLVSQGDHVDVLPVIFGGRPISYPKSWVKLPSEDDSLAILGWMLVSREMAGGATDLQEALAAAYKLDPKNEACIVVVTDGGVRANLVKVPKGRIIAAIQTCHDDDKDFLAWGKGCTAGVWRVYCKHKWQEVTPDGNEDPWELNHYWFCKECGTTVTEDPNSPPSPIDPKKDIK